MGAWFSQPRRVTATAIRLGATLAALAIFTTGVAGVAASGTSIRDASSEDSVVATDTGAVRGTTVSGTYAFRGFPYAAPPTGDRRWRAPVRHATWSGIRDATAFSANCPQQPSLFLPAGTFDEDCLYLNISTPTLRRQANRPVLVWIHGGGLTQDAGRAYDGTRLAAEGTVVVTINYRLSALGFLAHPALASEPDGSSGNYGFMDQQEALRWVQRNIAAFGGDPGNVTIAGQSAGGLSVLAHLVSQGSRGLFQRAIVESGSFALAQQSHAAAEAFGQAFAHSVNCDDQTAACLRSVPFQQLVNAFPSAGIPGYVDGKVLTESVGSALAAGRFARVPVMNGVNHDEQRIFVYIGLTVTGGSFVPLPVAEITPDNYQSVIEQVLGVSTARAGAIAAEYPVAAYPNATIAFSVLDNDASWACSALQIDTWLAKRVPTFAYEFSDDHAPSRFFPTPGAATHGSEIPYLLDQPAAPIQEAFGADSAALATSMRAAWASFAATGDPRARSDVHWPGFGGGGQQRVLTLTTPSSEVTRDFASRHNCAFWAGA